MQERLQCHCAVCFLGLSSLNIGRDPLRSQRSEVGSQRSDEGWKLYFTLCATCPELVEGCSLRHANVSTGHWLLDSLTSKWGDDVKGDRA